MSFGNFSFGGRPGRRGWWVNKKLVEVESLWNDSPLPAGDHDHGVFTTPDWPPHSTEALARAGFFRACEKYKRSHQQ